MLYIFLQTDRLDISSIISVVNTVDTVRGASGHFAILYYSKLKTKQNSQVIIDS